MSGGYDIDYLLDEVVTLPSLPTTVARITELVRNPDCQLHDVSAVISADPSIALKTLRLVNSAYYGLGNKVTSVDHAVVLLGIKVIQNLVFTASVFDSLKDGPGRVLRHSVYCGAAVRVLVEKRLGSLPVESAEEAFVYGLLHDVGKIIFQEFLPEEYEKVQALCRDEHAAAFEAENEIIGVNHAEVGGRLAARWKLPEPLVDAIAGHHELSACSARPSEPMAALLSVSDYICYCCGVPSEERATIMPSDEIWAASGLEPRTLADSMGRFFDVIPDVEELLSAAG